MQLRRRNDSEHSQHQRFPPAVAVAAVAAVAGIGVAVLSGLALASSPATLSLAKGLKVNGKFENVVVNSHGVTVYTLSGESIHHLECTKANNCFSFWFPVTVASARARPSAAPGIKGQLRTLRRDGFSQVTLSGRPVYTFIGDGGRKSRVSGDGIVSFGGTWHVIATSSSSGTSSVPGPMTTTTTTATAPYYP